jgi:hypothetical protein
MIQANISVGAPTISSQGAPARVYLNDNVTPVLLDGMRLLVKER